MLEKEKKNLTTGLSEHGHRCRPVTGNLRLCYVKAVAPKCFQPEDHCLPELKPC